MARVAKAVIIDDQDQYLLLKRANHPLFGDDFDLPGGTLEPGETLEQTALREIEEEIGVTIDAKLRSVYEGSRYSPFGGIWHLYVIRLEDRPEVHLSWEHSQYEWVSREEFLRSAASAKDAYMRMVAKELQKEQHAVSAGGVVFNNGKVLTIEWQAPHRSGIEFPKGTLEPGETQQQAALREVYEETGYQAKLITQLDAVHYTFIGRDARPYNKTVGYFLMELLNDAEPTPHREPYELFENRWLSITEARHLLTHTDAQQTLDKLEAYLSVNE